MSENFLIDGWPGAPSAVLIRLDAGLVERVVARGDLDEVRPWASVSKMAVALAFGVEHDWDLHHFDDPAGPTGSTFAHLLAHASGLGAEVHDPVAALATKRVYSNYGVDLAVATIIGDNTPKRWLDGRVFRPLGMTSTTLEGRAAAGVVGSTNDMVHLAVAWLRPDAIARATRDRMITPFLADLDGIVPGFGRFSPSPWGLGPEVRGEKHHWMGDWPPDSFGHFGQSGSLMLLNAREGIGLVATSTEPFARWARDLWPTWTSAMRRLAIGS